MSCFCKRCIETALQVFKTEIYENVFALLPANQVRAAAGEAAGAELQSNDMRTPNDNYHAHVQLPYLLVSLEFPYPARPVKWKSSMFLTSTSLTGCFSLIRVSILDLPVCTGDTALSRTTAQHRDGQCESLLLFLFSLFCSMTDSASVTHAIAFGRVRKKSSHCVLVSLSAHSLG